MNTIKSIILVIILLLLGCASRESFYKKSVELNTIEAHEAFLKKYPQGEFTSEIRRRLAELEFNNAEKHNTTEGFYQFLKKYPGYADLAKKAKHNIVKIEFSKAREINTIDEYKKFLDKYPDVEFSKEAYELLANLEYNKALEVNTSVAFKEFIEQYPKSKLVKEAQSQLSVIRIVVKLSWGDDERTMDTILCDAEKILKAAGYEIVAIEAQNFDATINIAIKGKAIAADYEYYEYDESTIYRKRKKIHRLYTGAEITGEISLKVGQSVLYSGSFQGKKSPPEQLDLFPGLPWPTNPNEADFLRVINETDYIDVLINLIFYLRPKESILPFVIEKLKDEDKVPHLILIRIKGNKILDSMINALQDKNPLVRSRAAFVLKHYDDPKIIDPLITVLKDPEWSVRSYARDALRQFNDPKITKALKAAPFRY